MINKNLLKAKITEKGYTQRTFAKKLKISANSLSFKMNNKKQFLNSEIQNITELLDLTREDIIKIFYPQFCTMQNNEEEGSVTENEQGR